MFCGSPNRKISVARKLVSLLVLGCLLLASTPIPMGLKVVQRRDSTPFPCMDCACGCATPEQCWTACCCFTPAERERWAEQHGVTPPSYAVLSEPAKCDSTRGFSPLFESTQVVCGSSLCSTLRSEDCVKCSPRACAACDSSPEGVDLRGSGSRQDFRPLHLARKTETLGGLRYKKNLKSTPFDNVPDEVTSDGAASCADAGGGQSIDDSQLVTVLSVVALRCKGASSEFTLLPWAIVDAGLSDFTSPEVPVAPYLVLSEIAVSVGIAPATPPPKC